MCSSCLRRALNALNARDGLTASPPLLLLRLLPNRTRNGRTLPRGASALTASPPATVAAANNGARAGQASRVRRNSKRRYGAATDADLRVCCRQRRVHHAVSGVRDVWAGRSCIVGG